MIIKSINAPDAPAASQAVEVVGATRLLFVGGQVPLTRRDELPDTFGGQCRLAWANVEEQLRAADLTLDNLVKITTCLADRDFAPEDRAVREQVLGGRAPVLSVIIAGLFDSAWLVEIEAIAVA